MLVKIVRACVRTAVQTFRKEKYAKAEETLATYNPDGTKKQVVVTVAEPVSKQ